MYSEPLYEKSSVKPTIFFTPCNGEIHEKEPSYCEQMLPVPWPFAISRFYCIWETIALTTGQIFFQRIALSTFQTIGASTTIILAERGYILTFVRQEYKMIIKVPAG